MNAEISTTNSRSCNIPSKGAKGAKWQWQKWRVHDEFFPTFRIGTRTHEWRWPLSLIQPSLDQDPLIKKKIWPKRSFPPARLSDTWPNKFNLFFHKEKTHKGQVLRDRKKRFNFIFIFIFIFSFFSSFSSPILFLFHSHSISKSKSSPTQLNSTRPLYTEQLG